MIRHIYFLLGIACLVGTVHAYQISFENNTPFKLKVTIHLAAAIKKYKTKKHDIAPYTTKKFKTGARLLRQFDIDLINPQTGTAYTNFFIKKFGANKRYGDKEIKLFADPLLDKHVVSEMNIFLFDFTMNDILEEMPVLTRGKMPLSLTK